MTDQTLPPQDETKSVPDEWLSLLTGQMASEDAGALLLRTAADMQQFLDARPEAEQHILEIIARRLPDKPTASTWQPIYGSINNYIGQQDLTDMISWVAQSDQANRLKEVEKYAAPRVTAFLRTIVGLYGTDLQEALTVMNQVPNDWRRLNRDVYFDMVNRRYRIKLRVELFGGDEFSIDAEPTMMLRLTSYVVRTLRYVPEPSAFTQADVNEFIEEARELVNLWFPQAEHAPATDETTAEDNEVDEEST